jgi:phenylalanyl-tRNA synthetase beta chain
MRPSIIPNLLEAVARNSARGYDGGRLFEIGPVYENDSSNGQFTHITAVLAPSKTRHWQGVADDALFSLKADLMALLDALGVTVSSLSLVQNDQKPYWHPGRSARLTLGPKTIIAEFGTLHPKLLKTFGLEGDYLALDVRLEALPIQKLKSSTSKGPLSRSNLMPLSRDFAFIAPKSLRADALVRAVLAVDKVLISEVSVFDVFEGKNIASDHRSLGIDVTLAPLDKTLTDADIEALSVKIITAANKLGANLRH